MARQGQFFDETTIRRIVSLLATTEMTFRDIAERMSCSRTAVAAINRKWGVRRIRVRKPGRKAAALAGAPQI